MYNIELEVDVPGEEIFVKKHEVSGLVLLYSLLAAELQLGEFELLCGDHCWGCGEFDAKLVADQLRIVVTVCLVNLGEQILDFLKFLGRIDDGQLADLSSLSLIEVIRQPTHEYQLRNQDDLIAVFTIPLVSR